jgi:transposase
MPRRWELRKDKTSFRIIDSQSARNADAAEKRGYDAGKTSGGHIAADVGGLPHAVYVTATDVTDRNGAVEMIKINRDNLSEVRRFLCDGGYSGKNFADSVREINGASVEAVKRNELCKSVVLPKRRAAGRSFGWPDNARRLRKNCERKLHTSLQTMIPAFVAVMLRRF